MKQILVLLLVAVWLPSGSHALLEHAGFIHHEHEHGDEHEHEHGPEDAHHHESHHPSDADTDGRHEHNGANHAAADGSCLVASGKVAAPILDFSQGNVWLTALRLVLPDSNGETRRHSGLSPPGTAPPELPRIWQFSLRTALPARAPSLLS